MSLDDPDLVETIREALTRELLRQSSNGRYLDITKLAYVVISALAVYASNSKQ